MVATAGAVNSSVVVVPAPPIANASNCVPAGEPPAKDLPVPIVPESPHDVPFQNSVVAERGEGLPPKSNAAGAVPEVPIYCLAPDKSPTSVHDVPFQVSVLAEAGGSLPPAKRASVEVPTPPA